MEQPRFLVDVNVGRLAKWLRVLGYDSRFVPDVDDGELVRVAREQSRTIVTRGRYIMQRRVVASGEVKAVLIASDDFRVQMQQLIEALGLASQGLFSRCIECNELLASVSAQEAKDRVPTFVFRTQQRFDECPKCGKLYWRGTHWRNMRNELAGFACRSNG